MWLINSIICLALFLFSDVCQQYPAAAPKHEWLAKYRRKVTATGGALKQSLSPLVEPLSKLGHNKRTGKTSHSFGADCAADVAFS